MAATTQALASSTPATNLALVRKALSPAFTVTIPEDASKGEVLRTLDICCETLHEMGHLGERLTLGLGYVLHYINVNKFYRPEHDTFKDFFEARVRGLSGFERAAVMYKMRIAKAFPLHQPEELAPVSTRNLILASAITKDGDRDCKAVLAKAATLTSDKFKHWAIETGKLVSQRGGKTPVTLLTFRADRKLLAAWNRWAAENEGLTDEQLITKALEMARLASKTVRHAKAS